MCTRNKIEGFINRVIVNMNKHIDDDPMERVVTLKLLEARIKQELDDEDLRDKANTIYHNKNVKEVLGCKLKKASIRKAWTYSPELQCNMADLKAKQKKEQIAEIATFVDSNNKYSFQVNIK